MARSKQKQPKKVTAAEKQIGERIAAFRKMPSLIQASPEAHSRRLRQGCWLAAAEQHVTYSSA